MFSTWNNEEVQQIAQNSSKDLARVILYVSSIVITQENMFS